MWHRIWEWEENDAQKRNSYDSLLRSILGHFPFILASLFTFLRLCIFYDTSCRNIFQFDFYEKISRILLIFCQTCLGSSVSLLLHAYHFYIYIDSTTQLSSAITNWLIFSWLIWPAASATGLGAPWRGPSTTSVCVKLICQPGYSFQTSSLIQGIQVCRVQLV